MCGIAGLWSVPPGESPEHAVENMLTAMRHRGPDGRGSLAYRGGAAGMVRLSLVDLSARGQQPIWSPDRRVAILFNGEIYNFREERARLVKNGYPFQSTTDTEVILALYQELGMTFVERLRGMYAVALFDWRETNPGENPTLILVRGPLGIKPLYVSEPWGAERGIIFASEIKSLLASGCVPREVDREGLANYLGGGFLMQPRTIISGVRMLEAGTWERFVPGRPVERHRYWSFPPQEARAETLDESADRLRHVLDESVRLHALADAPVGAFLSGGVDSTGIVALMREHISDLRTFTLRFPEFPRHDEAQEATEAAGEFGCRHTIVDVTGREVAQWLPQFAGDLDQPSTDGLNTWLISRSAARDVKAVLSGVGGDEWFAGYPVTRRMARYHATWQGRMQGAIAAVAQHARLVAPGHWLRWKLNNVAARKSSLTTWMHSHSVFPSDDVRALEGRNGFAPRLGEFEAALDHLSADWRRETPVGLSCLLDFWVYMQSQLLRDADATSMAHSLELRVPFVDLEIANFSRTCTDDFKLSRDGGLNSQYQYSGAKRVLIHALRDVLPPSLVTRPKRGFALPLESWLKGPLFPLLEATTNPDVVAARGLVDPKMVEPFYRRRAEHLPGVRYPLLWSLCMLELWCQAVLDVKPAIESSKPLVV